MKKFIFVTIYIAFLLMIAVGLVAGLEYYAYLKVKASPLGQAYSGRDLDLARRSSQTVAPQYGYEPTPGFAAVRNTKLGNSLEYINEESFKDFDSVPVEKPADEFRVIVTGGSVVYGRGPVPPARPPSGPRLCPPRHPRRRSTLALVRAPKATPAAQPAAGGFPPRRRAAILRRTLRTNRTPGP